MRKQLILHKQDFLTKSFSCPTLSRVKYSSGYLLFISHSLICFWIEYTCINTRKSMPSIWEKFHHCQRTKMWWTIGASFQPSPKKSHLKTHLHTMKVYITQPVWGVRTAIKSKNDHAYKIAYLKCKRKPEMWNYWIVEPAM